MKGANNKLDNILSRSLPVIILDCTDSFYIQGYKVEAIQCGTHCGTENKAGKSNESVYTPQN